MLGSLTSLTPRPQLWLGVTSVVVVLPLLLLLALLWPSIHFVWMDREAYSHGYLVLGIVLWLVFRAAGRTRIARLEPSLVGAAALAFVVAAAVGGLAADVSLLPQFAIPAIPLATLWAVAGRAAATPFIVPCAFMIFALPVWDVINEPLRRMTVVVAGALTRQSSIPAFIEGDLIRIPSGTFEVAGGCSGLHYFIVAGALGALYGLVAFERWLPRIVVLLFAAAIALFANWIRVFVIIVAGHLTDMQHYFVTVDHYTFGWVLFLALFAPLFVFGRYLEGLDTPLAESAGAAVSAPARSRDPVHIAGSVVPGMILVAGVWLAYQASTRPDPVEAGRRAALPTEVAAWRYLGDWNSATRPQFLNTDVEASGWYGRDEARVSVYVGQYAVQAQGKEAVFYANLATGAATEVADSGRARVTLADGETVTFTDLDVAGGDAERRVVWYGYEIAGRRTEGALRAKVYQALGALRGRWDAQVFVASAPCAPDCRAAREVLAAFTRDAHSQLLALIRGDAESVR